MLSPSPALHRSGNNAFLSAPPVEFDQVPAVPPETNVLRQRPEVPSGVASGPKTFRHSGRIGDIIYGLPAIRALGGGVLYLRPCRETNFKEGAAESLLSLLKLQPYIDDAAIWHGELFDHDLDAFRSTPTWRVNLAAAHLGAFGLPEEEARTAWLEAPTEECAPVVFSRSRTRRGAPSFWPVIYEAIGHCAVFVGSREEHRDFERLIGRVRYIETADLTRLAAVIAGAELFAGNQSAPYALAEAMKKPAIQECYLDALNCSFARADCLLVRRDADLAALPEFIHAYAVRGGALPTPRERSALALVPDSAARIGVVHENLERGIALVAAKMPSADVSTEPAGKCLDCIVLFSPPARVDLPELAACLTPDGRVVLPKEIGDPGAHLWRTVDGFCPDSPYMAIQPVPAPTPKAAALAPATKDGVSVVILTYNSAATIDHCIASLLPTLESCDEVVVVDNGSRDKTQAATRTLLKGAPNALRVGNRENLGFSAGCNVGIRISSRRYVVLLNPDTTVRPGWREAFTRLLDEPGVGAVGPVTDNVAGAQFVAFHLAPGDGRLLTTDQLARRVRGLHAGESFESSSLIGFCIGFRREVLSKVGLLDEDLFLGGEDLEMSLRLRLHGYRLLIARDVFVHHSGGKSFATVESSVSQRMLAESTAVLHGKLRDLFAPGPVPPSQDLFGCGILPADKPDTEMTHVE